jgi:hypothetical protein
LGALDDFSSIVLCDNNQTNTVTRYIPIFVTAVNQPPSIILGSNNFSVGVDVTTQVLPLVISDPDHYDISLISSYGIETFPPVSVMLSCRIGRLSLITRDNVVLVQGRGLYDRTLSIRGDINDVNTILANLLYTCRSQDGCMSGYKDVCSVMVDDEGFYGTGGNMQAFSEIAVAIISAIH